MGSPSRNARAPDAAAVRWIVAGGVLAATAAIVTWRSSETVWYGGVVAGLLWIAHGVRRLRAAE